MRGLSVREELATSASLPSHGVEGFAKASRYRLPDLSGPRLSGACRRPGSVRTHPRWRTAHQDLDLTGAQESRSFCVAEKMSRSFQAPASAQEGTVGPLGHGTSTLAPLV